MTSRDALAWLKDLPTFWKVLSVIATAIVAGWLAHGAWAAQAQLIPRMEAVEGRVTQIERDVAKLERIECLVLVLLGEGTQARCAVQ